MEDGRGHLFWTMTDSNDDAVVYKENLKKKSWNVVAHDRDELTDYIKRSRPESPPRRTSARISIGYRNEKTTKDLLTDFRRSIGRVKDN